MGKQKLQSMVKNKLHKIDDGIAHHGWAPNWEDGETNVVTCECGDVEMSGMLWVSLLKCDCGKVLVDITGLRLVGEGIGAATYLDPEKVDYEDGCVWVALVGNEKVKFV